MVRARKYEYNKLREEIVRTVLKYPKTTGEITTEVGYERKYNYVCNAIKSLYKDDKIFYQIDSPKKNRGRPPQTYDFVYDRNSIKKTYELFPSLMSDLQTNDKVLTVLIKDVNPETPFKKDIKDRLTKSSTIFKTFVENTPDELNKIYSLQYLREFLELISDEKCNQFEHHIMEKLEIKEFDIINRNTVIYLFKKAFI